MFELGEGDVATNPNLTPTAYTRAGNFTLNSNGYLTTQSGQYVVGATAPSNNSSSTPTYINVPPGSTNVAVGQDGSVTYTDENASSPTFGQTVNAGYISLATFPNDAGLERDGQGLLRLAEDPHPLVRLIAAGALARQESRGAHQRVDFPDRSALLDGRHVTITDGSEPTLETWS